MDTRPPSSRRVLPWALVCLGLAVVGVVTAVVRYDALPDPYPTHFGFTGEADAFEDKTWGTVLGPLFIGQLSGLVLFVIALALPASGARARSPLAALGCAIGGGTSLMCLSGYLADDGEPSPWVFWGFLVGTLLATAWLVVASTRMSRQGLATDPDREHWRLGGLVYVNRQDPDVLVGQRSGLGTTLNLGRPLGWLLLALLLLPAVVVIVMVQVST